MTVMVMVTPPVEALCTWGTVYGSYEWIYSVTVVSDRAVEPLHHGICQPNTPEDYCSDSECVFALCYLFRRV
jgi:hypothetical protein